MLEDILPPKWRKRVYAGYALVGGLLAAATTTLGALPEYDVPQWLVVANAVYVGLGTVFGATAKANTPSETHEDAI